MPRIVTRRPHPALLLAIAALVLAASGFSFAAVPGPRGVITGCYSTAGNLRVIDKGKHQRCRKGEKSITWSQTGPRGLTGPKGAPGLTGPSTGPAGGALTGSYPSPSIAPGAVGTAQIADGSVSATKLSTPLSLTATATSPFLSLTSDWGGNVSPYTSGAVLSGTRTDTSGVGPTIYGATSSIFGNAGTAGILGEATGTGGYGVYALHSSTSGFGIALEAATNGSGPALEADAGSGLAARLNGGVSISGNLSVSGAISAGTKDFKIDDPADPTHKFLVHTSVESPDAENIYNGNITTDARGYATVHLPSYFDSENIDPRYQLTVIGSFARAVVWKQERNDEFVIRTDQPRVLVSWQVTGIRNDPYARSQRGAAEQLKPANELGRYLYPQGFGKPAADMIGAGNPSRSR